MRTEIRKYVSLLCVIGFSVFFVYLFFFSNVESIVDIIGKTNITIYMTTFICVLCAAVFDALTWHQILRRLSVKSTFRRVFVLNWVGTFIDAIVPSGWSGDVLKAYLLSKDPGVEGSRTAASIVIKKVFELVVTLGALIAGLVFLVFNYSLNNEIIVVIGVIMALLALPPDDDSLS